METRATPNRQRLDVEKGHRNAESARIDCGPDTCSGDPYADRDRVDSFLVQGPRREMELQQSLRIREFEHVQRLKELELETEKSRATVRKSRPRHDRTGGIACTPPDWWTGKNQAAGAYP